MNTRVARVATVVAVWLAISAPHADACPSFRPAIAVGTASWTQAVELSGIAASVRNPGAYWTHNDSGDLERIFAITGRAALLGIYSISGNNQRDWEDIAVGPGPAQGVSYVYIGAIGANTPRNDIYVYRAPEPTVDPSQPSSTSTQLGGVVTLNMRYPNGETYNAETLMVDPVNHDIYVVTKSSTGVANVFVYPATDQDASVTFTLQRVRQIQLPGPATAGDFSPSGREILIKGYDWGRLWPRPTGTSVSAALASSGCRTPVGPGEAVGYQADSSAYYTIAEGRSSTLNRFSRGDPLIAAAGDIACDSATPTPTACRQKATSDLLLNRGLARILLLGDNQYPAGARWAYGSYFDPTWGRMKSIIRPSAGNHEYYTTGAAGYYDYFGSAAGDPSRGYYSFNIRDWHIIALNSNCSIVSCAAGSSQEQWLRADLAAHPARCVLAYWHHPRFSSGRYHATSVSPLWRALYAAGADIILNGHDHFYERFAPQTPSGEYDGVAGVRQFIVGTGGKSLYPFVAVAPNSRTRNASTFGVLRLTLHPRSYDWRFVPEAGKTFTDTGSSNCH